MKKLAIIGAGISGLSAAQLLKDKFNITIFERNKRAGGLIKCDRIKDNLFHRVGGHVFNSKNKEVLDWFWMFFDKKNEFKKVERKAKILIDGSQIDYPIENNIYQLEKDMVSKIIPELISIASKRKGKGIETFDNFEDFLIQNFGPTLYHVYFEPYNKKIWQKNLNEIPLGWLDGKLPMPIPENILISNILRQRESDMVHSTFYYPCINGSQFIVDRLSEGLNIKYEHSVNKINNSGENIQVDGEVFSHLIFTGDIRSLCDIYSDEETLVKRLLHEARNLQSNGTTNVFCECDPTETSWLYLADQNIPAHRIIYTGSFAESNNNGSSRMTCVVEFSGYRNQCFAENEVAKLPGNLVPLAYNYEPNSYVLQTKSTRSVLENLKRELRGIGISLAGRFAEWEYLNMDKAIESSMRLADKL